MPSYVYLSLEKLKLVWYEQVRHNCITLTICKHTQQVSLWDGSRSWTLGWFSHSQRKHFGHIHTFLGVILRMLFHRSLTSCVLGVQKDYLKPVRLGNHNIISWFILGIHGIRKFTVTHSFLRAWQTTIWSFFWLLFQTSSKAAHRCPQ